MKLDRVKVIFHHSYNFFSDNQILESFISIIPFPKLETHISETNKIAFVKIEDNSFHVVLIINDKSIQLHLNSLHDIEKGLNIINCFEDEIKKNIQVEFAIFEGALELDNLNSSYNNSFNHAIPEKYKIKMLGIDIQSLNYEYRVSINKKSGFLKVNGKALIKTNLDLLIENIEKAFYELDQELKEFSSLLRE